MIGAKVEHLNPAAGVLHGEQHRVQAIADVKVRLALVAVTEHPQSRWVVSQAAIEIEHVPVRVTLAKNRDKPENAAFKSKCRAVGGNQSFAGEFRGAIQRCLHWKWGVLWRWKQVRFPVDRTG